MCVGKVSIQKYGLHWFSSNTSFSLQINLCHGCLNSNKNQTINHTPPPLSEIEICRNCYTVTKYKRLKDKRWHFHYFHLIKLLHSVNWSIPCYYYTWPNVFTPVSQIIILIHLESHTWPRSKRILPGWL